MKSGATKSTEEYPAERFALNIKRFIMNKSMQNQCILLITCQIFIQKKLPNKNDLTIKGLVCDMGCQDDPQNQSSGTIAPQ